jgi:hypothetical protein
MTIKINDSISLKEINDLFICSYPFLKLEFYHHTHLNEQESLPSDLYSKNLLVGEVSKIHFNGTLKLHYWQKTGVIEQEFRSKAGLNVQIFRKNADAWIQTVGTDELTLEEQNENGMKTTEDNLHGTNRSFEREKKL